MKNIEEVNKFVSDIGNITDIINKQKQEMVAKVESSLIPVLKNVFEMDSRLKRISWTQYTPYFNDGDTCEFSVNEFYLNDFENEWEHGSPYDDILSKEKYVKFDEGNGRISWNKVPNENFDQLAFDTEKILDKIIGSISEDIWYDLYGDHCRVIISKNDNGEITIETEDYQHD